MSLRTKISLLIAAFMILVSAALFSILYLIVKENVKDNVVHNFAEQQKTILKSQSLIYDRLVESALLVSQNPAFKANVSLEDGPSVDQIIEEFLDILKVDLISVTNAEGQYISAYPATILSNTSNDHSMITSSLEGQIPEMEQENPIIWIDETNLYQVVSVPIFTNYEILGSLTLGTAITDDESKQLQLSPDVDIHFSHNNHIYSSTIEEYAERNKIASFISNNTFSPNDTILENENSFISFNSIDKNESTFLISSTSKSNAMRLLDQILKGMIGLALASILLIIICGVLLGRILSAPFVPVMNAFEKVENGDLDIQLNEKRNDEFGKLAVAFNRMIYGLKERIKLRTYVGGHTIDKLSNEAAFSQNINAAVLFSDIRGFTAYTQRKKATVVVDMLNKWLGFQAEIIMENGGSVDKFIGDEVMAIFLGDDAISKAINCAKEIQSHSKSFNTNGELSLGIGINFGSMIMGDIGIEKRKDHTVIGNVVNIASRLCSHAQKGQILLPNKVIPSGDNTNYQKSTVILKGIKDPLEIAIIQS